MLGIDPGEWALVWVGRLVPVKDPMFLTETLRHLTALSPDREPRLLGAFDLKGPGLSLHAHDPATLARHHADLYRDLLL